MSRPQYCSHVVRMHPGNIWFQRHASIPREFEPTGSFVGGISVSLSHVFMFWFAFRWAKNGVRKRGKHRRSHQETDRNEGKVLAPDDRTDRWVEWIGFGVHVLFYFRISRQTRTERYEFVVSSERRRLPVFCNSLALCLRKFGRRPSDGTKARKCLAL